ncbi:MAG: hypothetical protein HC828_13345 [Blastochloris sp.]|nr:hypothetical protein [Blastochloris sp.]
MTSALPVNNLVRQLQIAGERPTTELVDQIIAAGAEARQPVLELATRIELLYKDEPECWAPLHALRLLAELPPDLSIAGPLLERVPVELRDDEDELSQMWGGEVISVTARCGEEGIPFFWAWAEDTEQHPISRGAALTALVHVANATPTRQAELIGEFRRRLQKLTTR